MEKSVVCGKLFSDMTKKTILKKCKISIFFYTIKVSLDNLMIKVRRMGNG